MLSEDSKNKFSLSMKAAKFWAAFSVYMHAAGQLKSCNTMLDHFMKGVI